MKIIATVYSHPEYYPPTLNAVTLLAEKVEEVILCSRNVKTTEASYPKNVRLATSGEFKHIRETEISSYLWKIKSFLIYSFTLYQLIKKERPNWVIVYDAIPLLSFSILSFFLRDKPKLWYHNHDVIAKDSIGKYSISWFASINEANSFSKIDLFSLPSNERKQFFPLQNLKGKYFFLPNFPSLKNHQIDKELTHTVKLKLLYQGHVGDGHGLIEVINYIHLLKNNKLSLSIIGIGNANYIQELNDLIEKLNLTNVVKIYQPLPYHELKNFTLQHDVGLAILLPKNVNFITASTSSNKIYEYIASSMPVVFYESERYKSALAEKEWAFFTDLSDESMSKVFTAISHHYIKLASCAREDFKRSLNFEYFFNPILNHLKL